MTSSEIFDAVQAGLTKEQRLQLASAAGMMINAAQKAYGTPAHGPLWELGCMMMDGILPRAA